MIEEGQSAPSLAIATSAGETIDPAAPGGPLVLYFYPKDDTPGCTREAVDFTALGDAFREAGARVVGVSRDPMAKHVKFATKYGLKVPLAADEDGAISTAFGTWGEKSLYGRKYMGMMRATFLIDREGTVRRVWPKVKVAGHAEEVLAAVRAL
ncbi:peroxiredoxin [Sphingomonas mesophila]|uniref:peroxiredoxin n=1 Tax=Sphingomonas mesophila TaxID=2303576 RepID=UPI000E5940E0|nr:peroxiredoxin [Sphingomonas mesophila]